MASRIGNAAGARGGFWLPGFALCLAVLQLSCGLKAAPQPRELVVPEAVQDLSVRFGPEGAHLAFTLPDRSIDGTHLERIGGYRILREGAGRTSVRQEVLFSVTEQVNRRGKAVEFLDSLPGQAGNYRYCAVPLDVYGSRPRSRLWVGAYWEGTAGPDGEDKAAEGPGDKSP